MRLIAVMVLAAAALAAPATAASPAAPARECSKPSSYQLYVKLPREYPAFKRALVQHFGRSWKEAAIVSWGEGSWHWFASNGQYLGTFQMGSRERATYGHGPSLVHQVAAAARYWRASGRDWSPWECKPW